ncbi:cobyric acid synthase, partial [Nocardia gipuzkoensis]
GEVAGLGLFDVDIEFADPKILRRTEGRGSRAIPVHGYEIHHGRVSRSADPPWLTLDGVPEGSVREGLWGTHLHGLLESDEFRRGWLREVAARAGRTAFTPAPDTSVTATRTEQLDLLADLVEKNLDLDHLHRLIAEGPSANPPTLSVTGSDGVQ